MKLYAFTKSICYITILLTFLCSSPNVGAYTFNSVLKKETRTNNETNIQTSIQDYSQKNKALEAQDKVSGGKTNATIETGAGRQIHNSLYQQVAEAFGVGDCRLTQDEEGHHSKEGGHSLAIDFACTRGQSFPVTAPTRYSTYIVQHIGMDKYLGTYIILRHDNIRYVLGHTDTYKSNLKAGQTVKRGQYIGDTNESGERNTGEHVHVEKWKDKDNVSFITAEKNIYSSRLCEQRGWSFCRQPSKKELALEFAFNIIKKYEGFRTNSYLDGDGWSIGFGTRSFPGEVINFSQAHDRMVAHLTPKYNEVQDDFPNFDYKKQGALLSLYYNCPTGYKTVARQGIKALPGLCIRGKVNGVWQVLRGLQTRRNEEIKILNS